MITTSSAWKTYSETRSNYQPYIIVKKDDTVIWTFTPSNIKEGSVRFTDDICDPGEFKLGATISNHFEADIINFDNTFPSPSVFYGCIAELYFCLPSAVLGSDAIAGIAIVGEAIVGSTGTVDRILRGTYRLSPVKSSGTIVHIEGYDYMNDERFNISDMDGFGFTGLTPKQVIERLGFGANISYPNTMFTSIVLPELIVDSESGLQGISRRTVLGYLCEMCGCYARYAPNGTLLIKEFNASGTATEITKIMAEPDAEYYDLTVTGVHIFKNDTYDEVVGSDGYYLTIEDNPFIRTALVASQIATQLNTKYNGMTFTCFDVSWLADPSFEPGDYITFLNNGFRRYSIITNFSYDNGSVSSISFDANRDDYYSAEIRNAYSRTQSDIQQAMSKATDAETLAQAAQQTADGKITTFYQTTAPSSGMHTGDLWIDTDDNNKLYRYSGSAWVNVQDGEIQDALLQAANAKSIADSKIVTFAQSSQPTATDTGDLWVDTDDENKLYRWDGTAWVAMRDGTIATAQTTANNALTTANNAVGYAQNRYGTCLTEASIGAKVASLSNFVLYTGATVTIYFTYGNSASTPTLNVNGTGAKVIWAKGSALASQFYWKDGDTVTFIYDGTHWAMSETSANSIIVGWCYSNDTTYIDGANIYAGTITTDKLAANSVTANKIDINDLFSKNITATNFHITGGTIDIQATGTNFNMMKLASPSYDQWAGYSYNGMYCTRVGDSGTEWKAEYDGHGIDAYFGTKRLASLSTALYSNSVGYGHFTLLHGNTIKSIYLSYDSHGGTIDLCDNDGTPRLQAYITGTNSILHANIMVADVYSNPSDKRLKTKIQPLNPLESADFIYALKPCEYEYKGKEQIMHHGLVADDVEKAISSSKSMQKWGVVSKQENEEYKNLSYMEFIADIIATLQSQNQRLIALEQEV